MTTELNEPIEISDRLSFDRGVPKEELELELTKSSISYTYFEADLWDTEGFENSSSNIAAASFAPNAAVSPLLSRRFEEIIDVFGKFEPKTKVSLGRSEVRASVSAAAFALLQVIGLEL